MQVMRVVRVMIHCKWWERRVPKTVEVRSRRTGMITLRSRIIEHRRITPMIMNHALFPLQIRACLSHRSPLTRFHRSSFFLPPSRRPMSVFNATRIIGKTVLVTGASSGIGAVGRAFSLKCWLLRITLYRLPPFFLQRLVCTRHNPT